MAEINPQTLLSRQLHTRAIPKDITKGLADRMGLPTLELRSKITSREEMLFNELNVRERDAISLALRISVGELDQSRFNEFLAMHPGIRDLRMQLLVAGMWEKQDGQHRVQEVRLAVRSIYDKCDLIPGTPTKRLEALAMEDSFQLDSFYLMPMESLGPNAPRFKNLTDVCLPETALKLELFHAWLDGNNAALSDFWSKAYPSASDFQSVADAISGKGKLNERTIAVIRWMERVEGVQILIQAKKGKGLLVDTNAATMAHKNTVFKYNSTHDLWFNTPIAERFQFHSRNVLDLRTLASLAHKIRFEDAPRFTREETGLVDLLTQTPQLEGKYEREQHGLSTRLVPSYSNARRIPSEVVGNLERAFLHPVYQQNYHQQLLLDIAAFGETMQLSALRQAALRQAEFSVFSSFLGFNHQVYGSITYKNTSMKAKRCRDGTPKECEDNFSSARVTLPDGKLVYLDAVFDGMGGHGGGSRASEIAKEVFEIASAAGWISTPEDVRATIVAMDLAVVMDQIASKQTLDRRQINNMGTTVTISYQKENEFYGIHCGDSDWKIIRGGKIVAESAGHSFNYVGAFGLVSNEFEERGLRVRDLDETQTKEFYEAVLKKQVELNYPDHIIGSALGHGAAHIHINGRLYHHQPFVLQKGDIIAVHSDGIGVPICNHEIVDVIDLYSGDLTMARDALISMAEERRADNNDGPDGERITKFPTMCSCKERESKNDDDKTLMFRRV
ncbi:MAG: PP2C family serine/threonine-protein phosphatase [Candidatus Micrarchaeota archaeon]